MKNLILNSKICKNEEQDGDHFSIPEQLVAGEKESPENTELGGKRDRSCMRGVKLPRVN